MFLFILVDMFMNLTEFKSVLLHSITQLSSVSFNLSLIIMKINIIIIIIIAVLVVFVVIENLLLIIKAEKLNSKSPEASLG